ACRVYPPAPFRNEPAPAIEPGGERRRARFVQRRPMRERRRRGRSRRRSRPARCFRPPSGMTPAATGSLLRSGERAKTPRDVWSCPERADTSLYEGGPGWQGGSWTPWAVARSDDVTAASVAAERLRVRRRGDRSGRSVPAEDRRDPCARA